MNESISINDKTARFMAVIDEYKGVIAKVCSVYSSSAAPFDDLYQETLANLWSGLESYRSEARLSTWIYRVAINTCITWHRRNGRYQANTVDIECAADTAADDGEKAALYGELYGLIAHLEPIEKAIVTLWLDEMTYEEISQVMGMSKANVATRMHRIRKKLTELAKNE